GLRAAELGGGGAVAAKFDLTVGLEEEGGEGGGLRGAFQYRAGALGGAGVGRMARHFARLLEAVARNPGLRLSQLPLLVEEEEREARSLNATGVEFAQGACAVHELFERQAALTPDAVAVSSDGGGQLSYAELNRRSDQLAERLRALGVGPEQLVGVLLERSANLVVALLGVLKAGGAYLPLDAEYPRERLAFMLEDSGASVLLTERSLAGLAAGCAARILYLDAESQSEGSEGPQGSGGPQGSAEPHESAESGSGSRRSRASLRAGALPDAPAYVIYTSGSTGRPKGVVVTHRALTNHMLWMASAFALGPGDCVLQKTPAGFDASVWEFYAPLLCGGRLALARPGGQRDVWYLGEALRRERVSVLQVVPALLRALLEAGALTGQAGLRRVFCGGEALGSREALEFGRQSPQASLHNLYGPTECCIDATSWECVVGAQVEEAWASGAQAQNTAAVAHEAGGGTAASVGAWEPIGRPIANLRAYVADAWGQVAPVGVAGELLLGGAGLARGYLGRPGLTAERFVPDPFSAEPGARLYRTGDVARRLEGGELEYVGRVDTQVKLRGHRIEPGEVEAALREHGQVSECAVVAREDERGDKRLVAYVVAEGMAAEGAGRSSDDGRQSHGGGAVSGEAGRGGGEADGSSGLRERLRHHLRARLPEYMVPAAFVVMESLPLTPSGKLDRLSLPAPEGGRGQAGGGFVAPRDELERKLASVWEEVLGVKPLGVSDNFFDLGGHSLLAVRLMARIAEQCGRKLPLVTIFQRGTIEQLAELLRDEQKLAPWSPLVPLQPRGEGRPFFGVHAVGGTVFCYADLSRSLGQGRPFYALQAEGVEGGQSPRTNLEEMAARYVEAVSAVQPAGPYLLGGWSMGGAVAFEMARQLEARGDVVALLALFDSRAPAGPPAAEDGDHAALLLHFAQDIGFWSDRHTLEVLSHLQPAEQLVYIMAQAKLARLAPPELTLPQFRRLFNVFKANLRAVRAYQPQTYAGRVTLFKAAEAADHNNGPGRLRSLARRVKGLVLGGGSADASPDETFGWGRLAAGGVEVRAAAGNHYTMLREPHVRPLSEWLGARLRETDDKR
ncbi:MAG TPA: amino acid adenylation domain-containing protein, partial [Pyrinomonadaceae bacterium]